MNKLQREMQRKNTWYKYKTPGSAQPLRINHISLSTANSKKHEMAKAEKCYDILEEGHKFVTEAERRTKDRYGNVRRVDVVDLDSGIEFEIETTKERAKRFDGEEGVEVIELWAKKN